MSDRHSKWVRVEPGTVIPAGQPYRIEYGDASRIGCGQIGGEFVSDAPREVDEPGQYPHGNEAVWFIDSSWKPPLDLPTEPTWGIAVHADPQVTSSPLVGVWYLNAAEDFCRKETQGCGVGSWRAKNILDFIPLTDEQVKRIEGAR